MNPLLGKIAFARWFTTGTDMWPQTTKVLMVWDSANNKEPKVLPVGEQVVVRAIVTKGGSESQRVWLTTWSDGSKDGTTLMRYQPQLGEDKDLLNKAQAVDKNFKGDSKIFVYELTVEPKGEKTLELKVAAGDDKEQEPVQVRLASRPIVRDLWAKISPPAYVKDVNDPSKPAPAVTKNLMSEQGRAVEGATVTLKVQSSKPFFVDAQNVPDVKLLAQTKDVEVVTGVTRRLLSPMEAEMTFPALQSWDARLMIRDEDGFENRAGGTVRLQVVPDGLPSVVITDPRRISERSPVGMVHVVIQGTDDLGLDGVKLIARKYDAKPDEKPVFETTLKWTEMKVDAASGSTSGQVSYDWELEPLKLQPGARLTFCAAVQDNYDVDGKRHPWIESAGLTLQILSEADILRLARNQLNEQKELIKTLKADQEKTQSQTDAIAKSAADAGTTTPQQKEMLSQLTQQESQEASRATAIQQKIEQVKNDLAQNKMAESDTGKLAAEVSAGMKDVGQNTMPKAASELKNAHDAAGNQDPKDPKQEQQSKEQAKQTSEAAKGASQKQGEAIAQMNKMIDQLGAVGDMEAMKGELKEIQKKQDDLTKDTRDFAAKNAGKSPSQLSKEDKEKLAQMAKDQKDLSDRTNELIKDMKDASKRAQDSDPAASESMAKSAQAGKEADVPGKQSQASKEMKDNKTASASDPSGSQGQAQKGLQDMMDELKKNDKRALEQLQRQLAKLIDELKKLKASEEVVKTDTDAAGAAVAKAAATKLGDRQETLHMNTIVVQKKAENTKDAAEAAKDVGYASEQMGLAATALYKTLQPASVEPETKAIEFLASAIEKLQKQKDKVDDKLKKDDLAEFIKKYQAIQAAEVKIKESSGAIETRRLAAEDKSIDRLGLTQLSGLTKDQIEQIRLIGELSSDEKLKEYDVIVWMNGQIEQAMNASKDGMSKAKLGRQVASAQQTAIDRIQDIIDALKEEKDKPEFEKPPGSPPPGGKGGGKKPLLPPMAQLKLIKAMQKVVNSETVNVDQAIKTAQNDAEKTELKAEAAKVGKTQGELKGIVNKVVEEMKK